MSRPYEFLRRRGETLLSLITDMGPGFLVTIGFIDPGNIAVNVVAGARYGCRLLWVVGLGTLLVILLQEMSARLGIASRKCLSEATRDLVGPVPAAALGTLAGLSAVFTVLAELEGAAWGLNLLLGLPVWVGALGTAAFAAVAVLYHEYHHVEDLIVAMVGLIGFSYFVEVALARPNWGMVLRHSLTPGLPAGGAVMAVAVLGAIVMPSNFYLHSAIVQTRNWSGSRLRHEFFDTTFSMMVGGLINSAIMIVATSVFFRHGITVQGIADAARTMEPLAGRAAHTIFAVALIFSGLSSTVTGAMAGSYAIGGFVHGNRLHHEGRPFRMWFAVVLLAALALLLLLPLDALTMLVMSQVALGLAVPFSAVPLLILMRRESVVGSYRNGALMQALGWAATLVAIGVAVYMVFSGLSTPGGLG